MRRRTVAEERASIHGDLDRWYGEEYDSLSEMLDALLRAHAHELAEKIRTHRGALNRAEWPDVAAALITPEDE
jgi:hypothetical protein